MIGEVAGFLRDQLNSYLVSLSPEVPGSALEAKVRFLDLDQSAEHVTFPLNAISMVLLNIEEERLLREPDPFRKSWIDGNMHNVFPDLRLNLSILFVVRFKDYQQGLHSLSLVLRYFQCHRYFNPQTTPALTDQVNPFAVELISLSYSELNEIWGGFRSAQLPCLAYRIRTLVIPDSDSAAIAESETKGIETAIGAMP